MRKSIVIATCIVNSGVTNHPLSTVEAAVRRTFKEDFQNMNYEKWNENLPESVAQDIIKQFGNNYRVDVRQLIIDLT
jgi:hypothetical protein